MSGGGGGGGGANLSWLCPVLDVWKSPRRAKVKKVPSPPAAAAAAPPAPAPPPPPPLLVGSRHSSTKI